jgi:hypothetical protein
MSWIGCIFPANCPPAYVGPTPRIVWRKEDAKRFATAVEALEAAKKASFIGEGIDVEEIDDDVPHM